MGSAMPNLEAGSRSDLPNYKDTSKVLLYKEMAWLK
jgi:hypothetical protein